MYLPRLKNDVSRIIKKELLCIFILKISKYCREKCLCFQNRLGQGSEKYLLSLNSNIQLTLGSWVYRAGDEC